MSNISAAAVKALRDRTGAPMMDCKAALTQAGGEMEKAAEILRKQNKAIQDKKGERETAEGRIAAYIDQVHNVGALVEVRCESAPVAKSEQFVKLAMDLARHVAEKNPKDVAEMTAQPFANNAKETVHDRIGEAIGLLRENMRVARFVRMTGQLGSYVHHDGSQGVMVQVEGPQVEPTLLRDICMHIAAKNPVAARREDVPEDLIAKEKDIARTQAASTGKPAAIVEKIAEGKLKTWFAENVLLEQPFVKDDSRTIGDLLRTADLKFVKFARLKVGELS